MPTVAAVAAWLAPTITAHAAIVAITIAIDIALNFEMPEDAELLDKRPRWQLPPLDLEAMKLHAPAHLGAERGPNNTRVRIFDGFDPASPGLFGLRGKGDCLAPEIPHGTVVLIDRTLPVRDGDLGYIIDDSMPGAEPYRALKIIHHTADGIVISCSDGSGMLKHGARLLGRAVATFELPPGMSWDDVMRAAEAADPTFDSAAARRESNRIEGQKIRDREALRARLRESRPELTQQAQASNASPPSTLPCCIEA